MEAKESCSPCASGVNAKSVSAFQLMGKKQPIIPAILSVESQRVCSAIIFSISHQKYQDIYKLQIRPLRSLILRQSLSLILMFLLRRRRTHSEELSFSFIFLCVPLENLFIKILHFMANRIEVFLFRVLCLVRLTKLISLALVLSNSEYKNRSILAISSNTNMCLFLTIT